MCGWHIVVELSLDFWGKTKVALKLKFSLSWLTVVIKITVHPSTHFCHFCHTFLACITWTEDSISLIIRPPHNALHLPQQNLLHEDKNRRHFICKPGKEMYITYCILSYSKDKEITLKLTSCKHLIFSFLKLSCIRKTPFFKMFSSQWSFFVNSGLLQIYLKSIP